MATTYPDDKSAGVPGASPQHTPAMGGMSEPVTTAAPVQINPNAQQHPNAQQPYVTGAPPTEDVEKMHNKGAEDMARAGQGEWLHSLWDCFSPGELCIKSCCCPCFVFGKTQTRLEDPSLQTYQHVNGPCAIFLALNYIGGCGPLYQMVKRGEMRRAYGINGNEFYDCLASCCCNCCALMQMDKEVVSRQAMQVQGMQAQQGYQPVSGMHAVPQ